MKWFSRRTRYLRLHTLMEFDLTYHEGYGALLWEDIEQHPDYSRVELRLILAAFQYARTLVNHAETRSELFARVRRGADALVSGSVAFDTEPWHLAVGGMNFQIWPWVLTSSEELAKPKTYVSTLQHAGRDRFVVHYKMAFGLERVLAPSAALLPLSGLSNELTVKDRIRLGRLLQAVNQYYGSPDTASKLLSEAKAVTFGLPVLRDN